MTTTGRLYYRTYTTITADERTLLMTMKGGVYYVTLLMKTTGGVPYWTSSMRMFSVLQDCILGIGAVILGAVGNPNSGLCHVQAPKVEAAGDAK